MLLAELVACSEAVAQTRSRNEKIALLARCIAALTANEVEIAVAYLSGSLRQGRIGLGYATVYKIDPGAAAPTPLLSLLDVDTTLTHISEAGGKGSSGERKRLLGELLARATAAEQTFLRRLLVGEIRQGALAGVLVTAIARATELPVALVRRAHMLCGDLGRVAAAALSGGESELQSFSLELFRPLEPMLAQPCDVPGDAFERLSADGGEVALELKVDGARVQVHKAGSDVAVFTRRLKEVTAAVPEVVEQVRALPARELVLDGEVIAMKPDGTPHTFQTTMRRFGRKLDVAAMREELPLSVFYFDILHADDSALIDEPARERYRAMQTLLPVDVSIERLITSDVAAADRFLDHALEMGHEGIMAKSLAAPYAAGRRGADWFKIKPTHTLDLVVLAAEWGHGRRTGWLSNLHLGARNPDGSFTMLGKTFKGMTDEMLRWQTDHLQQLSLGSDEHVVHVRPELVVEVAFNDIQTSPHYEGGLALRFARVKRYRKDKTAEQADTIETVAAIHAGESKKKR